MLRNNQQQDKMWQDVYKDVWCYKQNWVKFSCCSRFRTSSASLTIWSEVDHVHVYITTKKIFCRYTSTEKFVQKYPCQQKTFPVISRNIQKLHLYITDFTRVHRWFTGVHRWKKRFTECATAWHFRLQRNAFSLFFILFHLNILMEKIHIHKK